MLPLPERMARFERELGPDACWIWPGYVSPIGYGLSSIGGRRDYVHRLAYEIAKGAIPSGLHIDHLCMDRRCFNPRHLEAVTMRENTLRGRASRRRDTCPQGHPYDEDNTGYTVGRRYCKACNRLRVRRHHREGPNGLRNQSKTHCKRGHPLSGDNLYVSPSGSRHCRTCRNSWQQRFREESATLHKRLSVRRQEPEQPQ